MFRKPTAARQQQLRCAPSSRCSTLHARGDEARRVPRGRPLRAVEDNGRIEGHFRNKELAVFVLAHDPYRRIFILVTTNPTFAANERKNSMWQLEDAAN